MLIEDAETFLDTGWFVSTSSTPASTLHAIFDQSTTPITFGISGDLDTDFALSLIEAIESLTVPEQSGATVAFPQLVGHFEFMGVVRGPERRFLRGWIDDDIDVIHVVPLYRCELTPEGRMQPFGEFKNKVDVFDMNRDAEPFFVFQMKGGRSQLRVQPWGSATYRELDQFVTILSDESDSRLVVRNRDGKELEFPNDSGWKNAHQEIRDFLVEA